MDLNTFLFFRREMLDLKINRVNDKTKAQVRLDGKTYSSLSTDEDAICPNFVLPDVGLLLINTDTHTQ